MASSPANTSVAATGKPASPRPADELLSPDFMARLDALEILSRKIFAGRMKGERRSKKKGESVEFADYRNYAVGDDLRFLDWNVYARLDRLMLKLFMEEEDLNVSILVDVSKSMDWGDPNKGLYVRRVAAALGYIGLVNYDRVNIYAYSSTLIAEMTGVRGRRMTSRLMNFIKGLEFDGYSDLRAVGKRFALRHTGKGVVIVLSDFFDKGGYEEGIRYLLSRNLDLYMVQVLSPEEIDPPLTGDLKLRDVEDDDTAEVTISRPLLERYKANLTAYCTALKDHCTRRGIAYLFTSTRVPFDTLVLAYLRERGLIR